MGRWRYWLYRLAYIDPLKRPAHATFGNSDPITADQLKTIHRAIDGATIRFRWQQGDFLLLDNFTVTHGRMPFRGNRRILVAMNDLGLASNRGYRKCAKICGDTSGNYHPHGEAG